MSAYTLNGSQDDRKDSHIDLLSHLTGVVVLKLMFIS